MTFFPDRIHQNGRAYAAAYFDLLAKAAASVDGAAIQEAADMIMANVARAGRIYSCGNGGSAAIANHLVCDCMKGVQTGTVVVPKVYSLSTTVEIITAIANDIGVNEIFAFQLASLAVPGDVVIAITSSGNSPNIVRALEVARERGVGIIAMTGFDGGQARAMADVRLHVNVDNYGIVEDVHQSIMHILAQYLRHSNLVDPTTLGFVKF